MHHGAQAARDSGGREEEHLLWGLHGPAVPPVIASGGKVLFFTAVACDRDRAV